MSAPTQAERAAFAAGLRQLADALQESPFAPLPSHITRAVVADSDQAGIAEVNRLAALNGTAGAWTPCGHYEAWWRHGPVEYRAVYVPSQVLRRWREQQSYCGNVQVSS